MVVQGHPRSMILVLIESATYWLKIMYFFLPHSLLAPSLPMFPLEFCGKVKHDEARIMGLSYSEDRMIVA